jgi:hypothetical protein
MCINAVFCTIACNDVGDSRNAHLVAHNHCYAKLISQALQRSEELAQPILTLCKLPTPHILSPAGESGKNITKVGNQLWANLGGASAWVQNRTQP